MAAPVYSTRFVGEEFTSSAPAPVVVPPGKIAVYRDITLVAFAAGQSVFVAIDTADHGLVYFAALHTTDTSGAAAPWSGRVVAQAGESLQLSNPGAMAVYVTVSGYLLSA